MANKKYAFNFDGGEELATIGATWFVSYAYHCYVDKTHMTWERVKTFETRKSTFYANAEYHQYWLQQVLHMDNDRLSTNKIGVDGIDVKRMAREVLLNM